jgi:hypothetical protein
MQEMNTLECAKVWKAVEKASDEYLTAKNKVALKEDKKVIDLKSNRIS